MIENGSIYFCNPCSSSEEYAAVKTPLHPDDLDVDVSDYHNDKELIVFFSTLRPDGMAPDASGDDHLVSENIGGTYQSDHPMLKRLAGNEEVIDGDVVHRLGEIFCSNIANCTGMVLTDAGPICPAFNNSELRKAL